MRSVLVSLFVLLFMLPAAAGSTIGKGNRFLMVTYWGDDKVALIDIEGESGREEVWSLDTLKAVGCAKPYDVRVNKRGDEAYVTCSGTDQVVAVDIVAQQVKYTVKTGPSPRDLQVFDDGRRLIVANSGNDTVSILDLQNRRKIYDIPVTSQPYGVAVSADNKSAAVTGWATGDLHFIALGDTSGSHIGKVDVGLLPYTVALVGDVAYVAAAGSHSVALVDMNTKAVASQIRVGRNPWSLAPSPDGKSLLVTNNRSNNLSLLRTGSAPATVASSQTLISAGAQTQANGESVNRAAKNASISANGNIGVFTDLANNQLAIINIQTGSIVKVINVGKAPYGIEFIRG